MRRLTGPDWVSAAADALAKRLRPRRIKLTVGGEPSYVPADPEGPEWNYAALGPTKLKYARTLANALIERTVPGAVASFSPGKLDPGERNPRWAIHLIWNRDGTPLSGKPSSVRQRSGRAS